MTVRRLDYQLLALASGLLVFGLLMLTSASSVTGLSIFGDQFHFIKRQVLFGLIPGLVAGYVLYKIPNQFWQKNAAAVMGMSLLLLTLVLIPGVGATYEKNARSWINIAGFSFQPAEFVKLGLILFYSGYILKRGEKIREWQEGFIPALVVGLLPIGLLLLQPDVGTAAILFCAMVALLYFAGAQIKHLGALLLVGLIGLGAMVAAAPYRLQRITTFMHPELDPQGIGYQINQAYLAIGSGGPFGLGLGHSQQKMQYLPEVHADSIFAIIAEETGFIISALFLIALYSFIRRLYRLAENTPDEYDRLILCGIATLFAVQSFFNIGAIVGLLPLTGVPLPLVSHGGSSLLISLASIGLALQISTRSKLT